MAITQEKRRIGISTPLGEDVLLLRGFTGSEAISKLFHFDLDLLSENDSIKFADVVGKNVTVHIYDGEGGQRYWNGFISRFSQGSLDRRLTSYSAQMVPGLWFLTRTSDCRIFQNKTAPDIIKQIFADQSFTDYEFRLYGSFATRDYCVQYRETDFNFISRLMEEEGIYYFFHHEETKHVMILANDPAAHEPCPNQETARYDSRGGGGNMSDEDVITEWSYQEEFRPGKWSHTDYNFETPSTDLLVSVSGPNTKSEIYDFPGEYLVRPAGDSLAKIRLQEQTVTATVTQGGGGCRYFNTGYLFTLEDYYRSDQNQKYLLTSVRHSTTYGSYQVGANGAGGEATYHNTFDCIPSSTPFRPARVTPTPFIQGCQTALVVGPAGEEIYTEKYGRIKVQFHWDRLGKKDENSSCWIRVSHPWAGKGYGSVSIPRIGQEVIVDFLEGNPDQPIIVGRVYNAEQMPPNGLPKEGMVSGIKSNSTPGGGGYNEMTMDDTKGKEKITVHAQYDMSTTVEHDQTTTVHNNRTDAVDVNDSETIGNNQSIKIGSDQTLSVGANQKNSIGASRTTTVGANDQETISSNQIIAVGGNQTVSTGSNQSVTVGAARTVGVTGADSLTVGAGQTISVSGPVTITSGASITLSAGGSSIVLGSGGITLNTGGVVTVTASVIKHNA